MIIYKVENKINGKIYIGQTTTSLNDRMKRHYKDMRHGSDVYFHRALRKYDKNDFEWSIIDSANSIDELNELEIMYIKKYNSFIDWDGCNGYNMTEGGNNSSPSMKTRKILREYAIEQFKNGHPNKGKTYEEIFGSEKSKEIKVKLSQINLGRTLTDEHREKIRQGNLGKTVTEEFRERMRVMNMGRTHSKETRKKISESLRGKPGRNTGNNHSEETKRKISNSKKGQLPPNAKVVLQLDLNGNIIKEWRSMGHAANELQLSQGNIHMVVSGKRNQTGGFKWKLKNE